MSHLLCWYMEVRVCYSHYVGKTDKKAACWCVGASVVRLFVCSLSVGCRFISDLLGQFPTCLSSCLWWPSSPCSAAGSAWLVTLAALFIHTWYSRSQVAVELLAMSCVPIQLQRLFVLNWRSCVRNKGGTVTKSFGYFGGIKRSLTP